MVNTSQEINNGTKLIALKADRSSVSPKTVTPQTVAARRNDSLKPYLALKNIKKPISTIKGRTAMVI